MAVVVSNISVPSASADYLSGDGSATDTNAELAGIISDATATIPGLTDGKTPLTDSQQLLQGTGYCDRAMTTVSRAPNSASPTGEEVLAGWALYCYGVQSQSTSFCIEFYRSSTNRWYPLKCTSSSRVGSFQTSGALEAYCRAGTWRYRPAISYSENGWTWPGGHGKYTTITCVRPDNVLFVDP